VSLSETCDPASPLINYYNISCDEQCALAPVPAGSDYLGLDAACNDVNGIAPLTFLSLMSVMVMMMFAF